MRVCGVGRFGPLEEQSRWGHTLRCLQGDTQQDQLWGGYQGQIYRTPISCLERPMFLVMTWDTKKEV